MLIKKRPVFSFVFLTSSALLMVMFQNCGAPGQGRSQFSNGSSLETLDSDRDGLPDLEEQKLGTDPSSFDTDGDSLADGEEVLSLKTNPLEPDTDGDGMQDGAEVSRGRKPLVADSPGSNKRLPASAKDRDNDGVSDAREKNLGTDPLRTDTDGDGLSDGQEINYYKTNPLEPDTDGGGLNDQIEVNFGLNPVDDPNDDDTKIIANPLPEKINGENSTVPRGNNGGDTSSGDSSLNAGTSSQGCSFNRVTAVGDKKKEETYKVQALQSFGQNIGFTSFKLECRLYRVGKRSISKLCDAFQDEMRCEQGSVKRKSRKKIASKFTGNMNSTNMAAIPILCTQGQRRNQRVVACPNGMRGTGNTYADVCQNGGYWQTSLLSRNCRADLL